MTRERFVKMADAGVATFRKLKRLQDYFCSEMMFTYEIATSHAFGEILGFSSEPTVLPQKPSLTHMQFSKLFKNELVKVSISYRIHDVLLKPK